MHPSPIQATLMSLLQNHSLTTTFVRVQDGGSGRPALMWKMQGNITVNGGRDRRMENMIPVLTVVAL